MAIASAANFDEVEKDLATAASRFEAALEIKPDFVDASTALAQEDDTNALDWLCAAAGLSVRIVPENRERTRPEEAHGGSRARVFASRGRIQSCVEAVTGRTAENAENGRGVGKRTEQR